MDVIADMVFIKNLKLIQNNNHLYFHYLRIKNFQLNLINVQLVIILDMDLVLAKIYLFIKIKDPQTQGIYFIWINQIIIILLEEIFNFKLINMRYICFGLVESVMMLYI